MKVKLGDVCKIQSGGTPSRSKDNYWNNGTIPWVKIKDFKDKYINNTEEFITEEGLKNSSAKMVKKGSILFTIFATLGEVAILNIDATTNQAIASINIVDERIERDYLYYYLKSIKNKVQNIGRGVAQNNINMSILKGFEFEILDKDKQKQIVSILDTVSGIIEKRKKQLEDLDELVKARFVEMFGDPVKDDDKYSKILMGNVLNIGSSKRIFEREYVKEGIPFYRTKEIVELSKGNNITTELFITKERYEELKKDYGVPKEGDLLISAVGTIGTIWVVNNKNKFYYKDGNLLCIRHSNQFNSIYLKVLLEKLIKNYKLKMASGTAYSALTISALKKMEIYDVPISEQNQFADFVKQTEEIKEKVQKSLDETQVLFNKLMQDYF